MMSSFYHPTKDAEMAAMTEPLCLERDVCRVIELLDRLQRTGELPPPKLQALQRVLQSKFCAAIREVKRQLERLDLQPCTGPKFSWPVQRSCGIL